MEDRKLIRAERERERKWDNESKVEKKLGGNKVRGENTIFKRKNLK